MELPSEWYFAVCIAVSVIVGFIAIAKFFGSESEEDARVYQPFRNKHGKLTRKMDKFESTMISMEEAGPGSGLDVTVLLIDSQETLDHDLVEKALVLLAKRYPALRMKAEKQDKGYFFVETDSTADFIRKPLSAEHWEQAFSEDSRMSFASLEKPLWRVTMLEEYKTDEGVLRNALLFTFHHALCDGGSIMALYEQFLLYLNKLHVGEDFEVESMDYKPPFLVLVKEKLKASVLEKCMFRVFPILMKFGASRNTFLNCFPSVNPGMPKAEKKTCIIPRVLPAEKLSKVAKVAKENKATIHGALTAANLFAMTKILNKGSHKPLTTPCKIPTSCNVSMRKECQPEVKPKDFGCYISVIMFTMQTPANSGSIDGLPSKEEFWKYAAECTSAVHNKIKKKEHFFFLKLFSNIEMSHKIMTDEKTQGRYDSVFNTSNRGRFDVGKNNDWAFKLSGTYFAMAEHHTGPVFGNNVVSVNGNLYWGLIYFPHIVSEEQASEFIDSAMSILSTMSE